MYSRPKVVDLSLWVHMVHSLVKQKVPPTSLQHLSGFMALSAAVHAYMHSVSIVQDGIPHSCLSPPWQQRLEASGPRLSVRSPVMPRTKLKSLA